VAERSELAFAILAFHLSKVVRVLLLQLAVEVRVELAALVGLLLPADPPVLSSVEQGAVND
jgi:hypothetical protein